jgi:t-SNARE complex subunit (syntaxin)
MLHNELIIRERHEELKSIEEQCEELVGLYKDMRYLIEEQGHNLDLIQDHIENAHFSVDRANKHLEKASDYQPSITNFFKMLKLW